MRFILPQLYDIRPRTAEGELDLARIAGTKKTVDLRVYKRRPAKKRRVAARRSRSHERFYTGPFVPQPPLPPPPPVFENLPTPTFSTAVSVRAVGSEELFPRAVYVRHAKPRARAVLLPTLAAALFLSLSISAVFAWRHAEKVQGSLVASVGQAVGTIHVAAAAISEMDVGRAAKSFTEAADEFKRAHEELSSAGFGIAALVSRLPVSSRLSTGKAVIDAGGHLASAGGHITSALRLFDFFSPEALLTALAAPPDEARASGSVSQPVPDVKRELVLGADELSQAADELARIDLQQIPQQYRAQAGDALGALPKIREAAETIRESADAISGIFGISGTRRYLVLLENAAELRPTGGFTGNIAILTVENGAIKSMRIEDVYLFDGQLVSYTEPPKPIQDISAAWSLHDANWFRDFPTSAKIAADFFEQTGQATPDGVIALTSKLFERILAALGPVETADGLRVDAATFTDTLNAIGASQRPGETTQVRAVASVLPAILSVLSRQDAAGRIRVREAVRQSIAGGDIQAWFRVSAEEKLADRFGLSGRLPQSRGDFLAVVHANVNGFKTDKVIAEQVAHEARIASDGSVIDTVTITRQHHGNTRTEPWYRKVNKTYTRLLVPLGATLLSAEGFTCAIPQPHIDYAQVHYRVDPRIAETEQTLRFRDDACLFSGEESGKTVFGGWTFVSPGEALTLRISYRLPFSIADPVDSYRLVVVKQPGWEAAFSSAVYPDVAWQVPWHDGALGEQAGGTYASASEALTKNRFFGIVVKKANSQ